MPFPVTFFNANSKPIVVNVNGLPFSVPGAAASSWLPGTLGYEGPTWSNTRPSLGELAPGNNAVRIRFAGERTQFMVTMNLPGTVQWNSVQIYFFLNNGTVNWIALNAGQYVTGGSQSASDPFRDVV